MTTFTPTYRIRLSEQNAPRKQAFLFTPEPRTEPPCEHPETEAQRTLAGGVDEICTVCRRTVDECAKELAS